ncbi:MAG: hypothetical protein FH762_02970 [Firmicutes bacterium]|nr:hypothetical protein [Bacillota bacterium]
MAVLKLDTLDIFFITILFGTQRAYGWNTVFIIITITEVLAMLISFSTNRYYKNLNRKLEKRKKDFI